MIGVETYIVRTVGEKMFRVEHHLPRLTGALPHPHDRENLARSLDTRRGEEHQQCQHITQGQVGVIQSSSIVDLSVGHPV